MMEERNNELFLNLAIKTTNLIIMAICSNFIIVVKFGLDWPTAILNLDALCNCFSVYLSFRFSRKTYDRVFALCHSACYGCCVAACYRCCLPSKLPDHLELEHAQKCKTTTDRETTAEAEVEIK